MTTTPVSELSRWGGSWRYVRNDRRLTVTWDLERCARHRPMRFGGELPSRFFDNLDSLLIYQGLLEQALIQAHWLPIDYVSGYAGDPCNVDRRSGLERIS